ncbi:MAG: DEAD/DEAH box helicase [Bacteroidetes bacterium]|jgi:ATP-dependent RNA helicase DeaD|nr:DEAD/DEAH box helicase [Bacteroidota bacterium]MCA6442226.1 DEAD/DEAH box helicase [Bacteroidota bacterium]
MTFQEIGLNSDLLKAVTELGFVNPTPIQQQTIPLLSKQATDLVALAQTGTGKTAGFGLPLLNLINANDKSVQALILAPTRELCVQITNDIKNYSKYMSGFGVTAIYGGARIDNQIKDIKRGVQVVVATPGRLIDMIERRAINLNTVKIVVLDEADEMLNMGFKEDLDTILSETPDQKNTWLFSATMPKEVERIARNYMSKPVELTTGKKNEGADNLEHIYYLVQGRDRYLALKRIADYYPDIFGIIFCRTKAETQEVADGLIKDGYSADALHGDLSQSQRDFVMKRFRSRTLQMLVATDVAARGIDVNDVTHVINYNLPEDVENYTHRTGRTARAGKSGIAVAIITPKDQGKIKDIERIIKKQFTRKPVPNGSDVCEKQLLNLVHKIHNVEVKDEEIESFLPKIYDELKDLSKEELIKRFISEEFNRFHEYYQNAPDLNIEKGAVDGAFGKHRTTRFFVNMGNMDGFNHNSLKDFLSDAAKLHPRMVFNVDVKSSFSFFETESKFVDNFLNLNAQDLEFNNRKISLEVSNRKMKEGGGGGERRGGGKSFGGGGYKGSFRNGEKRGFSKEGSGEKRDFGRKRRDGEKSSFGGSREKSFGGSKEGKSFGGEKKKSFGKSRF